MDFSRLSLPDWPPLALIQQTPDTILAALVSAVATLALVVGFGPRLGGRASLVAAAAEATTACDYLVDGASVRALTEPARALLEGLGQAPSRLAALSAHLEADCPGIQKDLEALVLYGVGFRHHRPRGDGTAVEILGQPRGGAAYLSIRPASEDARALQDARASLERAGDEARFLREVVDRAPVMAWSLAPDGQVTWANAAYRDRFDAPAGDLPDHRIADAFVHVLEEVPLTARGTGSRRRVSIPGRRDGEAHWYEVSQCPGPDGETLGYALEADDLVAAEASLRRFVETLTETFAHLPIGLAVFDKNRRLGLFNPALTELVKIDAVWLAGRPSLRDFLERLRETRQMPEQKDFASWRRKLGELEEGARSGTYEENWQLPSGKIFRVTGRPHPQGALAFLFEDISTAIQLERKYRSELELGQATLDRLGEAVAVFDASGTVAFVNSAFESLWGLEPMERLDGPGVAEMTRLWAERCQPSPVWVQLAEFATAAEERTSWTATVETRAGRALEILVAPLPDASALVVFRDPPAPAGAAAARTDDAALAEMALAQIQVPVEGAMRQLLAALPAAPSQEAFHGLSVAAQALKDGLTRSRELAALAQGAGAGDGGPMPGLAAALDARGLTLELPPDAATWPPEPRRVAMALGLAAADLAAAGAAVSVGLEARGDLRRLSASVEAVAQAGRVEPVSLALARRATEAARGRFEHARAGRRVTLVAELPAVLAVTAAEAKRRA